MTAPVYDVLIVGGGMVGASLAVALKPLGLTVGLIEAFPFDDTSQPGYDDRAIALSHGSSRIYAGMGLWQSLRLQTTDIRRIHVSDRGHFGAVRLDADQEGVPALGYMVESRRLGQVLHQALQQSEVELLIPYRVIGISEPSGDSSQPLLTVSIARVDAKKPADNATGGQNQSLQCRLLVAADGANSSVRQLLGIHTKTRDYQQKAVVANVTPEKPHNNVAYERFTSEGPIALLPLSDGRCSLVWTHPSSQQQVSTQKQDSLTHYPEESDAPTNKPQEPATETMNLTDEEFLQKLNDAFGFRLGRFVRVGKRAVFPLKLVEAQQLGVGRTVILGNAAHTLHPVAGQGLNLALRDIAVLVDLIAAQIETSITELGNSRMVQSFEQERKKDISATVRYTDTLVRLFSNDHFLLGHARAAGLIAVDRIPPLRHWLTRKSMGYAFRYSRLSRGLPLNAVTRRSPEAKRP